MTLWAKTALLAAIIGAVPAVQTSANPGTAAAHTGQSPAVAKQSAQTGQAIAIAGASSAEPVVPQQRNTSRHPDGTTDNLEDAVNGWIRLISQETGFQDWIGATPEISPLGPGTHSQLAVIKKDGKTVGYLVAGAAPDGTWMLSEYGLGDKPLFGMETLYRSLIRHGIIDPHSSYADFLANRKVRIKRAYYSPLEAFWTVTKGQKTFYYDAKTASPLPDLARFAKAGKPRRFPQGAAASGPRFRISDSLLAAAFDPFQKAVWVNGAPLPLNTEGVSMLAEGLNQGKRVTYAAKLYGAKVTAPFAVTGFQTWSDGSAYILLDDEGPRAIPFPELMGKGKFYSVE